MIRALIFDCFGVFYADPVFTYMRDKQTPPEKAKALHTLDKQAALGSLSKVDFVTQAADILDRPSSDVERQFFHSNDRNQELIDFTQKARKQYKIALLSNIGSDMMDSFFAETERKQLFDIAILSGDVRMAKPDAAIFQLVLNKLDIAPAEAIFIDDSHSHIQGAEKVGIKSIQFLSNTQLKQALLNLNVSWP